ncbi:MAG: ArsC/Spx/MgsR family protein [Weeksellaceae bacterium]|jgi:arsenate reductase|nr:ArsC/Spx/MgsR family protein [Weeksellaceae bacterium]
MKKIYYLSSCDSCRRILKQFDFSDFEKQNIKQEAITEAQLEEMKNLAGSYEALFSRKAQKYKALGLKNINLKEDDYKAYILSDYTFLKRPVILNNKKIFIGSDKKTIEALSLL